LHACAAAANERSVNDGRPRCRSVCSGVESNDRDPPVVESVQDTLEMRLVDDVDAHGWLRSASFNHHPLEGPYQRRAYLPSHDDVVADRVAFHHPPFIPSSIICNPHSR
jgi:hypothetical protein